MKEKIVELLFSNLKECCEKEKIRSLIEIPPNPDLGDYAFPCFILAKILRKSPSAIAEELREKIKDHPLFENITAMSGYLNLFVDKKELAKDVFWESNLEEYGKLKENQRIVIEFTSPNTNKPLHLGHLRNMSIGESVCRILEFCGNTIIRTSINNDRGIHICKSMLAYMKEGGNNTPETTTIKGDHFVGDYYVLFNKRAEKEPNWNEEAQKLLVKWEAGDEKVRNLWKKMNKWALDGFRETYSLFGIKFDKEYYESEIYTSGKEIVIDGLKRNIFSKRNDGAVIVDLSSENLGEKVLLRSDGTSVYIVQDLYLALLKDKDFSYDKSIYVVGNEQEYHFTVLKAILKRLGYSVADKIYHLSYGMVELPEGKMKSREGKVVDADDLILETKKLAAEEIRSRYKLDEEEIERRSLRIALAAIKYQLLRSDITKNILFDPKKAISFEGDTGPYLLYSYARASSILRKSKKKVELSIEDSQFSGVLTPSEVSLLKKVDFFPDAILLAYNKLSPSVIANYTFELCQIFNEFYHSVQVIDSENEIFKLKLVQTIRNILKKCIWLLGFEEIEEM